MRHFEVSSLVKNKFILFFTLFLCLYTIFLLFSPPHQRIFGVSNQKGEAVRVTVLHYMNKNWGGNREGLKTCQENLYCEWFSSDDFDFLREKSLASSFHSHPHKISLGLYHIHSLYHNHQTYKPLPCKLPTNIAMYESEEAYRRFKSPTFDEADKYFEANCTVHPKSDVQRVYELAYIGKDNWRDLMPQKNLSDLIKASAYIASDCHKVPGDISNTARDDVVLAVRGLGFRVDGIGKCMHSDTLPAIVTTLEKNTRRNPSERKRDILNNYAFYFAFENFIDDGYVTEKVFEGLLAGIQTNSLLNPAF